MTFDKIQFEAGEGKHFDGGVNYLIGNGVYAEVAIPEGCSEDYGYLTMKKAIQERLPDANLAFWYDGQEQYLAEDANADCEVYVEIEEN